MIICMRTTLNLNDHLYAYIKDVANETDRSITSVVHDFLLESLHRRRQRKSAEPVELPVSDQTGGTLPGVDINDNASVLEIMERGKYGPA